jgi:hypothetical protein
MALITILPAAEDQAQSILKIKGKSVTVSFKRQGKKNMNERKQNMRRECKKE